MSIYVADNHSTSKRWTVQLTQNIYLFDLFDFSNFEFQIFKYQIIQLSILLCCLRHSLYGQSLEYEEKYTQKKMLNLLSLNSSTRV